MPRLLAGSAIIFALACAAPLEAAEDGSLADYLTNLVKHDCGSCHGIDMKGGLGRPLTVEALEGVDAETLKEIILHGIPDTAMPGWHGLISESDAAWIAAGLKEGRFQ